MSRHRAGILLILVSAFGFGAMGIFARLAYDHGANTATLLTLRFALAGTVLWLIVAARGGVRAKLTRRTLVAGSVLGLAGYSLQAGGYFAALQEMDVSVVALVLYTYPAMVFIGAVALRRERASGLKIGALLLSGLGLGLVVAGGGAGSLNGTGMALALGAALAYTTYILVADTVISDVDPFALTALILTGAFASVGTFTIASGQFDPGSLRAGAWGSLVGVSLISTVLAATTFFLGLERVGPSTASIVSTVEPAFTVALALPIFGESLSAVQVLGGVLVLGAVILLQLRMGTVSGRVPPDHAAPAPAAREVPDSAA